MLLDLIIALIILVVAVVVLKYLWGFFELPPALLHVVMMILGAVFLIYFLIAVWPFITHPGAWHH